MICGNDALIIFVFGFCFGFITAIILKSKEGGAMK